MTETEKKALALVERLRDTSSQGARLALKNGRYASGHEAADLIETQTREIERLRGLVSSYRLQIDQLHDRAALAGDSHGQ